MHLTTEVSRAVHDSSFSMDELFYRYFRHMPTMYCTAGSSDLCSRGGVRDYDEENEENPHKGPAELQLATDAFIEYMKTKNIQIVRDDPDSFVFVRYVNFPSNAFKTFIVFCRDHIIVQLHVTPSSRETLTSMAVLGGARSEASIWAAAEEYCNSFVQPPRTQQDEINIIGMSHNDFYLQSIPLRNKNRTDFSYEHYNEDFEPVSKRILESLQGKNESGLVLLHGDPGTGKTSYLKYLLHAITKKKLIYLPPDMIEHLSAPNFISFMLAQASNSILLIEDAENVLRHREAGGNQAVSNILNISDGILGDVLRLQIVCTFNSSLDDIDKALLRPGRLIAGYRFEKLKRDRANVLMQRLHNEPAREPMTLAEVFNFNNMPDMIQQRRQSVGFVPT